MIYLIMDTSSDFIHGAGVGGVYIPTTFTQSSCPEAVQGTPSAVLGKL